MRSKYVIITTISAYYAYICVYILNLLVNTTINLLTYVRFNNFVVAY